MNSPRNASDPQYVAEVLDRNRESITRRYNAVGCAVGKQNPTDDSYVIVVYLRSAADARAEPQEVEQIPVKFVVTGEIRPHIHQ